MQNRYQDRRSTLHCPRCRRLISKNTPACSYCGLQRPKFYVSIPLLGELIRDQISFIDPVSFACIALYAIALLLDLSNVFSFDNLFSLLSPSTQSLFDLGMGGIIPIQQGRWWTLITATYLHGSLLHILFNMLWLRQIGPWVEELFGNSRFFMIYTFAGLSGSLVSAVAGTSFFVGASGAVFGLFGALIYYGWHRGGTFGRTIFRQMIIWAAIGFILGFTARGVDNWGHFGGFIGGVIAAIGLGYEERQRQSLQIHIGAAFTVLFVLLCFGLQAWTFFGI